MRLGRLTQKLRRSPKRFVLNRLADALANRHSETSKARALANLKYVGEGVRVGARPELYASECIALHRNVHIGDYVRLQGITLNEGHVYSPTITIGEGSSLENSCTITANNRVEIGKRVLIAGNVFISDHTHRYENVELAVHDQGITDGRQVIIGDGCHLGQNVCVFGDVTIGEHVIVGANSVVTGDIPAFSVAVGAPARVVKRHNPATGRWERC